jgi:NADP-dependent 3-hydroxy acid dehydrogenase YdfG
MTAQLKDKKVILITGGSEGFGKEIACLLAKNHTVVILSNNKTTLCETGAQLCCDNFFCDITNPKQVEEVVSEVLARHKKIDVLINNAGIWAGGALDTNSYDDIAKNVMVNVLGTMFMTRAVLPHMKKQGSGKIVNIGSTNGLETKPDRSVYIASKWAIVGFTGALRKELSTHNIAVIGINPGLMKTTLHKNAGAERDYSTAMYPKEAAKAVEFAVNSDGFVVEQLVFRNLELE